MQHKSRSTVQNTKLCLAIYGKTIPELRRKLLSAKSYEPDYVELRLDYLEKFDLSTLKNIGKLAGGNTILTFRSKKQGGKSSVSEHERVSIIEKFAAFNSCYVDVETETLESNPRLLEIFEGSDVGLMASHHDFRRTPTISELKSLLRSAPRSNSIQIIKIACRAASFEDNTRLLSLYGKGTLRMIRPAKLLAFCMGEYGIFSRFASLSLGAPFGYASLPGEATAPGQLDIATMRAALGSTKRD